MDAGFDQGRHARPCCWPVALSFLYRLAHRAPQLLSVHWMDALAKDAEVLVLRHQLSVLRRQVARPRFGWSDRALVALLCSLVPRERWRSFLVTPQAVLGWHRLWGSETSIVPLSSRYVRASLGV